MKLAKLLPVLGLLTLSACAMPGWLANRSSATDGSAAATPVTPVAQNWTTEYSTTPAQPKAMVQAPAPVNAAAVAPALPRITLGESSVTVERMALSRSCEAVVGAARIGPAGAQERYEVNCKDGRVLVARCDLRQCSFVQ